MSRFDIDITERLRWDMRYTNGHVPLTLSDAANEIERLREDSERLRAALKTCEAWLDRWTQHIGSCQGGHKCTCGRTAVLHEASDALTHEQSAGDNGVRQTNDEVDTDKRSVP